MKLVEDDGTVVDEFDDDVGVVVFSAASASLLIPKPGQDDEVPRHVVLAAAVLAFLSNPDNVIRVLDEFHARRPHRQN